LRAVTTATAAAVLAVDRKSLGNLLARLDPGVLPAGRQGVARRIPVALLEELALAAELATRLAVPAREAFDLAQRVLGRNTSPDFIGSVAIGEFLQLGVDLRGFRAELHARLALEIESQVRPRRGRPRKPRVATRKSPEVSGPESKQAPGA
jgi:hypothetical protein